MTSPLFRQEAIEHRKVRWAGNPMAPAPRISRAVAATSIVFVVVVILFFSFGRYTQHVRLEGQLVPSAGLLTVAAPTNGVVSRVLVEEGANVRRGDLLLELSGELTSHTGNTREIVAAELESQRSGVQQQIASLHVSSGQEVKSIERRIGMLGAEMDQIDSQIKLNHQQVKSYMAMLAAIQPLRSKGFVSEFEVQERQAAAIGSQSAGASLKRERLQSEQEIEALQEQLRQAPLDLGAHESQLRQKLAELMRDDAENESQRLVEIPSPSDGIISYMGVKQGQTVAAGARAMLIVPRSSTLQAEILAPSRSIGLLKRGEPVVIRYAAFPFERYGSYRGQVTSVSTVAVGQDPAIRMGQDIIDPMYRVEVALDRQLIDVDGKTISLRPGMALSADILLERRKLSDWIFEPLTRMAKSASAGIE